MTDQSAPARVYPVRRWVRLHAAACAVLGWGFGLGALLALQASGELWWGPAVLLVTVAILLGTLVPLAMWRLRIVVTQSRIDVGSLWMRGLDRDDIAGIWVKETPVGYLVRLVPHDTAGERKVEFVAQLHEVDDWFMTWLDGLPRGGDPPGDRFFMRHV